MDNQELKKIISDMLKEGANLSEIQSRLASEYNQKLTFLDLKLIVSDIEEAAKTLDKNTNQNNIDTTELKDIQNSQKSIDDDEDEQEESVLTGKTVDAELMDEGATVVELDKLVKPGTALSGSVKFASGAKAEWAIDHYGRLTLQNAKGKPTQEDIMLFQEELSKKLGG